MLVVLGLVAAMLIFLGIMSLMRHSGKSDSGSTNTSGSATNSIADVCAGGAHLQNAAAYTSGAGQPMALYVRSAQTAGVHYNGVYTFDVAPLNSPAHNAYAVVGQNLYKTYSDKQTPAVVACITRSDEVATSQKCTYSDNKSIPVDTASYRLSVYESRTHRRLLSQAITALPTYTCASYTTYDGKAFYRSWDPVAVAEALLPFASGQ
jgi:hypothetical protein